MMICIILVAGHGVLLEQEISAQVSLLHSLYKLLTCTLFHIRSHLVHIHIWLEYPRPYYLPLQTSMEIPSLTAGGKH